MSKNVISSIWTFLNDALHILGTNKANRLLDHLSISMLICPSNKDVCRITGFIYHSPHLLDVLRLYLVAVLLWCKDCQRLKETICANTYLNYSVWTWSKKTLVVRCRHVNSIQNNFKVILLLCYSYIVPKYLKHASYM